MMFEPIEEMLSFWHWWEKCKRKDGKGREEDIENEEEDPDQEEK
ncbi:unnamed protein product [marine sediment metagenome]|uniref:Uncharacterized protein n=1 Tax=marine sediment metagenome TaxID=412755 RepID=X0WAM3_9ZZZZ